MSAVLTALSVLLFLNVIAPLMAPYGTFTGLDGLPASIDHGWQGHGPASMMYLLGDVFCHQEMDRSFILNGSQLPVCIRDMGILAGAVAGCVLAVFLIDRLKGNRVLAIGIALTLVTGIEWCLERVVGDMPAPRFLSGIVTGIGASILLGWWIAREYERGGQAEA